MGDNVVDAEGYLLESDLWDEQYAEQIAAKTGVCLSSEHWQLLHCYRNFYQKNNRGLSMRMLVKLTKTRFGERLGNSIRLTLMFGTPTSSNIAKIAGLPKPPDCV